MISSKLNLFLSGKIDASVLRKSMDADIEKYATAFKKQGSLINLNYHEDEEVYLDSPSLNRLLTAIVSGVFTSAHLSYLCDCFTLSENINYENEQLEEIVFSFADPEINGGFKSVEEIREIIKGLRNF